MSDAYPAWRRIILHHSPQPERTAIWKDATLTERAEMCDLIVAMADVPPALRPAHTARYLVEGMGRT